MKKFICFIFAVITCLPIFSQVTNYDIVDGKVVIKEVVTVEGKSKSALYQDALLWVNSAFKSPKTVIQTKDADLGLIALKSMLVKEAYDDNHPLDWYDFDLTIQIKDGRYKYEFSNLVWKVNIESVGLYKESPIEALKTQEDVDRFIPIIANLKEQMAKPEEDW
jgi:hypothetical protein